MRRVSIAKKYIGTSAVAILAILVLAAVIKAPAIKRQLNAWKLLPQPERLSELYYENHTKLATTYTPGTAQAFTFTVHNLEYRGTSYSYTISEQSEDGTRNQDLDSGSFALPEDAYHKTSINVVPADLGRRVQIITTLHISGGSAKDDLASSESLHYWVVNPAIPLAEAGS